MSEIHTRASPEEIREMFADFAENSEFRKILIAVTRDYLLATVRRVLGFLAAVVRVSRRRTRRMARSACRSPRGPDDPASRQAVGSPLTAALSRVVLALAQFPEVVTP